MKEDNWCIAEEKKYMGGGLEIFMTSGLDLLYDYIVEDIKILKSNPYYTGDYYRGLNDALAVIAKRFGVR
jgi:hypothetical protein